MPTWLAPLLLSLAEAFPRIAALFTRAPVPEPPQPHAGGWAGIDSEEDAAVRARAKGAAKPTPETVGGQTK